jgi:hypothetical protein
MNKEVIVQIEEIKDVRLANIGHHTGKAQVGMHSLLNALYGYEEYDGYKVTTSQHEYFILISNGQNCCENWGYMISEDDFEKFIGKKLVSVELTNTALDKKTVEDLYAEEDQIQFVDFKMSNGLVLQFTVYNAHNGYYGHPIIVAKDTEILLQTTL